MTLDIPGGLLGQLEEDLAAARAAVLTGVVPESDLPSSSPTLLTGQRIWPGGSTRPGSFRLGLPPGCGAGKARAGGGGGALPTPAMEEWQTSASGFLSLSPGHP